MGKISHLATRLTKLMRALGMTEEVWLELVGSEHNTNNYASVLITSEPEKTAKEKSREGWRVVE